MSLYIKSPNDYIFTPNVKLSDDLYYNPGIHSTTVVKSTGDDLYIISDSPLSPSSPLIPSVRLDYSRPIFGFYEDLNHNKSIIKRMVKYIHLKTLDEWLMDDLLELLNYVKVSGNKVELIKGMNEYKHNAAYNEKIPILEKKVDFIERNFLSLRVMQKIVKNFIKETGYNYVDLPHVQEQIKTYIERKLKKMLKHAVLGK